MQSISNGTKKKIRTNSSLKSSPTSRQDYFSIWTAREAYDDDIVDKPFNGIQDELPVENDILFAIGAAPPLPPRNYNNASLFHKPLERSWPPRVHKPPQAELIANSETFQFDIIDTDDPVMGTNDIVPDIQRVDFVPGEFFEERSYGQTLKPREREECAPLATPETDGSLSETNVLRLAAPKTPENVILKPLLKKKIGPDNYISTILTQKIVPSAVSKDYSFPANEATNSFNALVTNNNSDAPVNSNILTNDMNPLKPHRPLRRQLSANNAQTSFESSNGTPVHANTKFNSSSTSDEIQNRHFTLCRKPSLRSPRQRSPPSESSTRSTSPLDHASSSPEGAASPLAQLTSAKVYFLSTIETFSTNSQFVLSSFNSNRHQVQCN